MGSDSLMWYRLNPNERRVLLTVAAMHRELGPDAKFETAAVEHCAGEAVVAELGLLVMFGLLERFPEDGGRWAYRLNGEGLAVIPASDERRALEDHREEADQALREGRDGA